MGVRRPRCSGLHGLSGWSDKEQVVCLQSWSPGLQNFKMPSFMQTKKKKKKSDIADSLQVTCGVSVCILVFMNASLSFL